MLQTTKVAPDFPDPKPAESRQIGQAQAHLALAAGLSAPSIPKRRSEPGRTPGPEASSGSGSGAPPGADRVLRTGWERTL